MKNQWRFISKHSAESWTWHNFQCLTCKFVYDICLDEEEHCVNYNYCPNCGTRLNEKFTRKKPRWKWFTHKNDINLFPYFQVEVYDKGQWKLRGTVMPHQFLRFEKDRYYNLLNKHTKGQRKRIVISYPGQPPHKTVELSI